MGLHRNLRALHWFDQSDMDEFLPRMFNAANPWELQDFVEDFFFTAAAAEVERFVQVCRRRLCLPVTLRHLCDCETPLPW